MSLGRVRVSDEGKHPVFINTSTFLRQREWMKKGALIGGEGIGNGLPRFVHLTSLQ